MRKPRNPTSGISLYIKQRDCTTGSDAEYWQHEITEAVRKETARIPAHFREATCDTQLGDSGLYLHGPVGTGKTYAAAALAIQAVKAGLDIKWISSSTWLTAMKASFNGAPAPDDVSAILTRCDLLVIDDLGSEKSSEWAVEQLFVLINEAYEQNVQLIVTSNLKFSGLNKRLGSRIVSRLVEVCDPVAIEGEDRRKLAAKARRQG